MKTKRFHNISCTKELIGSLLEEKVPYSEFERISKNEHATMLFGREINGRYDYAYICDTDGDEIDYRFIYEHRTGNIYRIVK